MKCHLFFNDKINNKLNFKDIYAKSPKKNQIIEAS